MIDKNSETWRDVAEWAEKALAEAYARIAEVETPLQHTGALRGDIRTLTALLALVDKPEPRVIETAGDYGFQNAHKGY